MFLKNPALMDETPRETKAKSSAPHSNENAILLKYLL